MKLSASRKSEAWLFYRKKSVPVAGTVGLSKLTDTARLHKQEDIDY